MRHNNHHFPLNMSQQFLPFMIIRKESPDNSQQGIQFIQRAVRFDPDIILINPLATMNTGLPFIATSRLNPYHNKWFILINE